MFSQEGGREGRDKAANRAVPGQKSSWFALCFWLKRLLDYSDCGSTTSVWSSNCGVTELKSLFVVFSLRVKRPLQPLILLLVLIEKKWQNCSVYLNLACHSFSFSPSSCYLQLRREQGKVNDSWKFLSPHLTQILVYQPSFPSGESGFHEGWESGSVLFMTRSSFWYMVDTRLFMKRIIIGFNWCFEISVKNRPMNSRFGKAGMKSALIGPLPPWKVTTGLSVCSFGVFYCSWWASLFYSCLALFFFFIQ